jgi:hypothetical protein
MSNNTQCSSTNCLKITSLTRLCSPTSSAANNNAAANANLLGELNTLINCAPKRLTVTKNGQTVLLSEGETRAALAANVIKDFGCPVKGLVTPGCSTSINCTDTDNCTQARGCLKIDTSKRSDGGNADLLSLLDP